MRISLTVLSVALLVIGCSSNGEWTGDSNMANESKPASSPLAPSKIAKSTKPNDELTDTIDEHRRVIYDAKIDLIVNSFSVFTKTLPTLVIENGGYVADVKINQRQDKRSGQWKVRIKSQNFDQFVLQLAETGIVENHRQTAHDVTSEFVDLDARIVNKKRMESRVLDLINESNRGLKDVIGLEKELSRIRGDIERMQGKLNLLANKTDYATLTITATEQAKPQLVEIPAFKARVLEAWNSSIALLAGWIGEIAVFFVRVIPWLAVVTVILVPLFVIWNWRIRRDRELAAINGN